MPDKCDSGARKQLTQFTLEESRNLRQKIKFAMLEDSYSNDEIALKNKDTELAMEIA